MAALGRDGKSYTPVLAILDEVLGPVHRECPRAYELIRRDAALRQRFGAAEKAVDQAALAGDEAALRTALAGYVSILREAQSEATPEAYVVLGGTRVGDVVVVLNREGLEAARADHPELTHFVAGELRQLALLEAEQLDTVLAARAAVGGVVRAVQAPTVHYPLSTAPLPESLRIAQERSTSPACTPTIRAGRSARPGAILAQCGLFAEVA